MSVCPACNSLAAINKNCPLCGCPMYDAGAIQDFYDNYSAFLEQEIYEDGYRSYSHDFCVHLFACPNCHFDINIKFRRLNKSLLF
ncbi:hypothetical protein L7E55_03085 [Pelotomaculum isophthalicicum JI]|uniref:Uncharacterized protein n=1 Tax=Pelotomaculum isophthalicicum JI TaxID=947010 RepID=A0A9X4H0N4_9FIRM|nr:hypothetical protein [Pelotomaculum isophthalicicum]MDF9407350.1 hypothetical protein [Pelotomaculum isophthalicicum JI]